MYYRSGLDVFIEDRYQLVSGKNVGLVTNHTGLTSELKSNIDLFYQHPEINLVKLFGPEHGVRGNLRAGAEVDDMKDPVTGLPVFSLYGEYRKPTAELLNDIDVLIYDIQDVGVRFYTYLSTLFYLLEACGENGVELIVLDRLNPLGRRVEGNIVKEEFFSFVGLYPVPQRYGMTAGELAFWANNEFQLGAELNIIKLEDWKGRYFDEIKLPWIPPSPNIPSFDTALVYPVTCMFEGTNLSEGRGTACPFSYTGAPWVDPGELHIYLKRAKLPGVEFRPVYFIPSYSKHKGEECGGVQLFITDRNEVNSHLTGLTMVKAFFDLYPGQTNWRKPFKERYMFDLLLGTDEVRKGMEAGKEPAEIIAGWSEERLKFEEVREKYLLYS